MRSPGRWHLLTFVFTGMIAGYLFVVGKKIDARPEDDKDGEIYQAPATSASSRRRASGPSGAR